jgi:VanZ family protein
MPPQAGWSRVVWYWGPAIAAMAAIFTASSLPTVPRLVRHVSDLLLHFAAYAGLAVLVIRAIASGRWTQLTAGSFLKAWVVSAGYGITDELHQYLVPGRYASVADWIADALGAASALAMVAAVRRYRSGTRGNRAV